MSEAGEFVNKYSVSATFESSGVSWRFLVELSNGERCHMDVVDGAEIPILLDIMRADRSIYFDPRTGS